MTHKRSFSLLSVEELELKHEHDSHRLEALKMGFFKALKRWRESGLDDPFMVLYRSATGRKKKRIEYLQDQIVLTRHELARRDKEVHDSPLEDIITSDSHPARLYRLNKERQSRRRERVANMHAAGEDLYPNEWPALASHHIRQTAGRIKLGRMGDYLSARAWSILAVSAAVGLVGGGVKWFNAHRAYQPVAEAYVSSGVVAGHALPLKRDVPEIAEGVSFALTYTPELTGEDDDGNEYTIIDEHKSNPAAGRAGIIRMGQVTERHLSEGTLETMTAADEIRYEAIDNKLSPKERVAITRARDAAYRIWDDAADRLMLATDDERTYGGEIGMAWQGNSQIQHAVSIMERHVPPNLVAAENKAYGDMRFWKYFTMAMGVASLALGRIALRENQSRRQWG